MEHMQEIVFTILVAMILSFHVVKLVSKARSMSRDSGLSKSSGEVLFKPGGKRWNVQTSLRETKVDSIYSERVRLVDRFQVQCQRENPVQVDNSVEIEHRVKDMTAEEAVQLHFPEVMETDEFGQQYEAGKLQEKSSGQASVADDVDDTVTQSDYREVSSTVISVEPSSEEEKVVRLKEFFGIDAASDSKEIVEHEKHLEDHDYDDDDDDDDWEGIERTELEKVFAAAAKFVDGDECKSTDERLFKIGSDAQMKMYGLQKMATEGPCREPQPMPLKILARAKWNAWRELGNMNPEEAMEKYISLLSDRVPEWMKETSMGHVELESTETKPEILSSASPDLRSSEQSRVKDERNLGLDADAKQDDHVAASELEAQAKK